MAALDRVEAPFSILLDDDSYPIQPDLDMVRRIGRRFTEDARLAVQAFPVVVREKGETVEGIRSRYDDGRIVSHFTNCACALRMEAYRDVAGYRSDFDSPYGEESELSLRLMSHGWLVRQYRDPVVRHHESPVSRDSEGIIRARTFNTLRFIWWYFPAGLAVLFSANVLWNRFRTAIRELRSPAAAVHGIRDFVAEVRRGFDRSPLPAEVLKGFFGVRFNRIRTAAELSALRSCSWAALGADYLKSRRRHANSDDLATDAQVDQPEDSHAKEAPFVRTTEGTPKISVVIPAHNAAEFLGPTLDSACGQTYADIEVIVVDDGSCDDTADIACAHAGRDPRIRVVRQKNAGVAAARNRGIELARGAFIAPLDADDVWYPRKIERQLEAMLAAPPEVGLVSAAWECIDEKGRVIPGSRRSPQPGVLDGGIHDNGNLAQTLVYRNPIACASVPLIRKSCFENVGGYNTRMFTRGAQGCEDWDLYLRIAEHYQFTAVDDCLVAYRQRSRSMSQSSDGMARSFELMMEELEARRPDVPTLVRYGRQRFYWYLSNLCGRQGDRLGAASWLAKAIWADPTVFSRVPAGTALRRVSEVFRSDHNGLSPSNVPTVQAVEG